MNCTEPITKVEIFGHKEVEQDSFRFTVYSINIHGINDSWTIYRRYREFFKLHQELVKIQTPPVNLPGKAIFNFLPQVINDRIRDLNRYLEAILYCSDKTLRSSSAWHRFLGIPKIPLVSFHHSKNEPLKKEFSKRQEYLIEQNWINCEYSFSKLVDFVDGFTCFKFDDEKVVTGSMDKKIRIYGIRSGLCHRIFSKHTAAITCLDYNETLLVSGSVDCSIIVWEMFSADEKFHLYDSAPVTSVQVTESFVFSSSQAGTIKQWVNGKLLYTTDAHRSSVNQIQVSNNTLVSSYSDGLLKVWRMTDNGLDALKTIHTNSTCISLNDNLIISGSRDNTIRVWDATSGMQLKVLVGHEKAISSVFCDAKRIISASLDKSIKIWDRPSGCLLNEIVFSNLSQAKLQFNNWMLMAISNGELLVFDFTLNLE